LIPTLIQKLKSEEEEMMMKMTMIKTEEEEVEAKVAKEGLWDEATEETKVDKVTEMMKW
jgi:hypothetical protein